MKRYTFSYKISVLAICIISLTSCIQRPDGYLKSEVQVSGGVNYFEKSMNFGFEGGEHSMSFYSNLKWSINISNPQNGFQWLTIDPQIGNKGSYKVTFTAEENNTYEDRSVIAQFLAGDTIRNIIVNQKRLEAITLANDRFEVPISGGYVHIIIYHSMDYGFTIPEDYKSWIHHAASTTRGSLNQSVISFTIDPNDEYEKREGRIYFTAGGEEEVVNIYQDGCGKIVLSQNEYNLTGAEQEFTVDISSNFDFNIEMPDAEWLIENGSTTRGMSTHSLKFKVTKNNDYNARTAKIKIYDKNSEISEKIVVNQASNGPIITLSTKEFNVSSEKQDLDIEVSSNFYYDVDFQGANWIKTRTNNTRGIYSRLLKLTIEANNSDEVRTANIKLYDKNSPTSETITIIQKGKVQ